MKKKPTVLGTLRRQSAQGATFGAGDELKDAAAALTAYTLSGGEYKLADLWNDARAITNEQLKSDWEANPGTAIIGNLGGGVLLGGTGAAKAATNWVMRGGTVGKLLKTGVLNSGLGAAAGYASGEGDGRIDNSKLGAVIGGVTSPIVVGAGAVLADEAAPILKAAKQTTNKFSNKAEKYVADQLAKRPDLAQSLEKANEIFQLAKAKGVNITFPEAIAYADSDPLIAQQAKLGSHPMTGGKMAAYNDARKGQIEGAYENVASQLSPIKSADEGAALTAKNAKNAAKRITEKLTEKASPLYKEAFDANKSMASPVIDKILDTPGGKEALSHASELMQNQILRMAVPDAELTQAARDLQMVGKVGKLPKRGVASGLKMQTLDNIKKGFDIAIEDAISKSAPGTMSAQAKSLMSLKNSLVSEIDRLDVTRTIPAGRNPNTGAFTPKMDHPEGGAYARARAVYSGSGDDLAMREHMGNLSDIDPQRLDLVAPSLLKGSQQSAQNAATALGPQDSATAAATILRHTMENNQGNPLGIANKLAPRGRMTKADQLAAYAGESSQSIDNVNELARKVNLSKRMTQGSPTDPLNEAGQNMQNAAGAAVDLGKMNISAFMKKAASFLGRKEDPQFYEDMYSLFTTDKGMELAQKIANHQGTALQKITNPTVPQKIAQSPKSIAKASLQAGATITAPSIIGQNMEGLEGPPPYVDLPGPYEKGQYGSIPSNPEVELEKQQLLNQLRTNK